MSARSTWTKSLHAQRSSSLLAFVLGRAMLADVPTNRRRAVGERIRGAIRAPSSWGSRGPWATG